MIVYLGIILAGIVVDQLVKYWATVSLLPIITIPIIQDVFHLTYARNTGAAFSMLQGKRWFFILAAVIMTFVLIYVVKKKYVSGAVAYTAVALIISGTIGNLIDRIMFGYVVDMFDFRLINFAIFNVADCCLTIGTILLVIYILIIEPKQEKKKKELATSENNSADSN